MNGAADILRRFARRMRIAQLSRYAVYALATVLATAYALHYFSALSLAECVAVALGAGLLQVIATDLLRGNRRVTRRRTVEHLDRRFPELQDSTALLLEPDDALSPLQRLQRARIATVLLGLAEASRLEPASYRRLPLAMALSLLAAALLVNLFWLMPGWQAGQAVTVSGGRTAITGVIADIESPAYTRMAPATVASASVSLTEFARLRFTVTVSGAPETLRLVTGDDRAVELYAAGDGRWQSVWWEPGATTYQFLADGEPVAVVGEGIVHAIAVSADRPPAVAIREPVSRLQTVSAAETATLAVALALSDDFGVTEVAARVTRSSGSGEQVAFEERTLPLFEAGPQAPRELVVDEQFDLIDLGLAPGSELYLHFEARDARPGGGNVGESQTLIVRWRDEDRAPDIVLDNQVVQVMPEYFRSQRQIIIDSEALIAERATLDEAEFSQRAQSLALDQKALRLRYGQFMGEEEGGEPAALPGESSDGEGHYAGDGHDHADSDFVAASQPGASNFGDVQAAIEPYAHMHDQAEQATLFDPETRGLLRQALSAMWQAEGELRQFRPSPSLPHQYQALALIKRVQNRARVFVARVGFEPTPVDPGRRLTGELDDIAASGALGVSDRDATQGAVISAMLSLNESGIADERNAQVVLDWLQRELSAARAAADDALVGATLDAEAALKQWRIDPDCADCAARLARYWQRHSPAPRAPAARPRQDFDPFATRAEGSP